MFRRRRPDLPAVDAPIEEHLDAILAGTEGAVPGLVRSLAAGRLWQAALDLPLEAIDPATGTLTRAITFANAVTTMPDGTRAAMVSTTAELAAARTPGATPYARPGDEVLREIVADPALHAVVVNPAGRYQVLASDWVAAALA